MPMIIFLPATFKVIIGTEQIWLMVELVVQINRAARILNYPEEEEGLSTGALSEYGLDKIKILDLFDTYSAGPAAAKEWCV